MSESESESATYWKTHAIVMALVWSLVLFVSIAAIRWFSMFGKGKTVEPHALMGWIITIVTMFFGITAIKRNGGTLFRNGNLHTVVGGIIVLMILPTQIGGIASLMSREKAEWKTPLVWIMKKMHGFFGWIIIILSIVQLIAGLGQYYEYYGKANGTINWNAVYIPVMILVFAACEFWYRYKRDFQKLELKLPEHLKGTVITEKEFEERIGNGE